MRERRAPPDWQAAHVGTEGDDFEIDGLVVWKESWRQTQSPNVYMPHPDYRDQIHSYAVCEIGDPSDPIKFAVGEISNGVWGFYVKTTRQ